MRDNDFRKKVKLLKATGAIENYYELAELLEITEKSFYNWLCGYYDLGEKKRKHLIEIEQDLCIPQ